MSKFFNKFPKVYYSLEDDGINPEVVTDITLPINILEPFAQDSKYFYETSIADGMKPEDVAYIIYGDTELHWVILHFNKILDPRFEWLMPSAVFDRYIVGKYGSIQNAYSSTAKYYKVITKSSSTSLVQFTQKIEIPSAEYANLSLDLVGTNYNLPNGETVNIKTSKETLTSYDYEVLVNDSRRFIKLIQKQYIDGIRSSFNRLVTT